MTKSLASSTNTSRLTLGLFKILRTASEASVSPQEILALLLALNRRVSSVEVAVHEIVAYIDSIRDRTRAPSVGQEDLDRIYEKIETTLHLIARNVHASLRINDRVLKLERFTPQPQADVGGSQPVSDLNVTETERLVLSFLHSEGPKSSREIMQRIRRSREHTARLLKTLYERGYVERSSRTVPFRYTATKQSLLKSTSSQATTALAEG